MANRMSNILGLLGWRSPDQTQQAVPFLVQLVHTLAQDLEVAQSRIIATTLAAERKIMKALDNLTSRLTDLITVGDGLATLLGTLHSEVLGLRGKDDVAIEELANRIAAKKDEWAVAIQTNTDAAPTTQPAPANPGTEPGVAPPVEAPEDGIASPGGDTGDGGADSSQGVLGDDNPFFNR